MISNAKFEKKKFDGMSNFCLWQYEVQDVVIQQGLNIALEDDKPEEYTDKEWDCINK